MRGKTIITVGVGLLALAFACSAQNTAPQPAAPAPAPNATFLSYFSDPLALSSMATAAAFVSEDRTDWHMTVAGKVYSVSAAQRFGIAGATIFGVQAVAHKWPKLKPYLAVAQGIASVYLAGKAYANTLDHGTVAAPVTQAPLTLRLR